MTNREKKCIIIWQSRIRLVGQAAKTSASHAENMGSIPVRVTIKRQTLRKVCLSFYCASHKTEPTCANTKFYFLFCFCARGSHTATGGILRYSACRPPNSKFPYHSTLNHAIFNLIRTRIGWFFFLVTRTRNLTRRRMSLGSHTPRRARRARS